MSETQKTTLDLAKEKYNIYSGQSEKKSVEENDFYFLGYKLRDRLTTDLGELGFALYDPQTNKCFNLWIHQNLVVVDVLWGNSLRPMNSIAHQVTPLNIDPKSLHGFNFDLFDTDNAFYVSTYFPRVGGTMAEIRHYQNGDEETLEYEHTNPQVRQVINKLNPNISYLDVTNHIYRSEGKEGGKSFVCDYQYDQRDRDDKPCWKRHYTFSDKTNRIDTISTGSGCLVSLRRKIDRESYLDTLFSYKDFSIKTSLGEFVFYAPDQQIELYQKQLRVFKYSGNPALPTTFQDISLDDKLIAEGRGVYNQKGQLLSFRTTELIETQKSSWGWLFPFSAHKLIEGKVTNTQFENNKYKHHTVIENTKTKKSRETFIGTRKIRSITLENGILTRTRYLKDGTELTKITKPIKNGIDYVELKNDQVIAKGFYHKNGSYHIVSENGFRGRDKKGFYTGVVMSENESQKIEKRTYKNGKVNVLIFDLANKKVKVMSQKAYDKMIKTEALKKAKARLKRMKQKGLLATNISSQQSQNSNKKSGCIPLLLGFLGVAVALATCSSKDKNNEIEPNKKSEPTWLNNPLFAKNEGFRPRLPDPDKRIQPKKRPLLAQRVNENNQRQNG